MSRLNNKSQAGPMQWRLRTLLLLVTVMCVLMTVRQVVVGRYQQQQLALSWYEELDPNFSFNSKSADPTWLAWFFGGDIFQDVNRIHWDLCDLPAETRDEILAMPAEELFSRFKHFSEVESLSLEGRVTDNCLPYILANMPKLRDLQVEFTEVTPAGLVHINKLTRLEELGINDPDKTSPCF